MNIFSGLLSYDQNTPLNLLTKTTPIKSPLWEPDHTASISNQNLMLSCSQRFIKPTDASVPMPYQEQDGLTIAGDIFLTDTQSLKAKLAIKAPVADVLLIAQAYRKWGISFLKHLDGDFLIIVFDPSIQTLIIATDHKAKRTCFYKDTPSKQFCFSNHFPFFRSRYPELKINEAIFEQFALDCPQEGETAYQDVFKIPQGCYLIVQNQKPSLREYWSLKDEEKDTPHQTRDDYYEAFKETLISSTHDYLESGYRVDTQISGGLDSSAITCISAQHLANQSQTLNAFVAVPGTAEINSFRAGWKNHELDLVYAATAQYQNIKLIKFISDPSFNPLEALHKLNPLFDQPFRNTFNFEWISGNLKLCLEGGARSLLHGGMGNFTISWYGEGKKNTLTSHFRRLFKQLEASFSRQPHPLLRDSILYSRAARKLLNTRITGLGDHHKLLQRPIPRFSASRAIDLHFGVNRLDPTSSKKILSFCYNTPQAIYQRGKGVLNQRLLVREGLKGIVPKAILTNRFRGEQASDWYLQYNRHARNWLAQLDILSPESQSTLWRLYDQNKLLHLSKTFIEIEQPNSENVPSARQHLTRFLAACQYHEALINQS